MQPKWFKRHLCAGKLLLVGLKTLLYLLKLFFISKKIKKENRFARMSFSYILFDTVTIAIKLNYTKQPKHLYTSHTETDSISFSPKLVN